MPSEDIEQKKKDILSKIFLKEEDTLKELGELVSLSSGFFKIEQESASVIFNQDVSISNRDKIILLLIGKYFSKEMGVLQSGGLQIADISKQLGILNTTVSAPLGNLVKKRIIRKNENGEYSITHHQIKTELQRLKGKAK
jgi:hypothetical protein